MDEVLVEARDAVLVVTLNRPDARNAINAAMATGLLAAMEALDEDDSLAVAVLTGAGDGFCAGLDLRAFLKEGAPRDLPRFVRRGSEKPLVVAIEGFALGGGLEVALTCDLLVAGSGARLGIPEATLGLLAAGGALLRLPRRVPYGVAVELALTGASLTSERAHEVGLVDHVTDPGAALDAAMALARRVAASAPLPVVASKRLLRDAVALTEDEFWSVQRPYSTRVFESADAREGAQAFAERRSPQWLRD